jgi:hypothetical protein
METVKISVNSEEKASRPELFVRFFWGFVVAIILGIVGVFAAIAIIVQWLHILFLAKRHPSLSKFINSWYTAMAGLYFYMYLSTDERPPLVPSI